MFNNRKVRLLRLRIFHLESLVSELAYVCRAQGVELPAIVHHTVRTEIGPNGEVWDEELPSNYDAVEEALKAHQEKDRIKQLVNEVLDQRRKEDRQ